MGKLNLDEISAGMTLAANVVDRNGRTLLKQGLELTERHLTILKQWGVTEADIQDVRREEIYAKVTETLDQGLLAIVEAEREREFLHTDRLHPFIKELFRLSVVRAVEKRMEEKRNAS